MNSNLPGREGLYKHKDNPMHEELDELRPLYVDYLRGEIDTFRSLLARRDLEDIRSLGHRLKGSGGSYGFQHISDLGEAIQYLQDSAEWEEIESLLHQLEETYEQLAEGL
jgi:HPt (histidine-containing phosphotransfer) domain-containing protein